MSEPILAEPIIAETQPHEEVKVDTKPQETKSRSDPEGKINCGCGSSFLAKNRSIHEKTKKHMTFMGLCPAKPKHPEDGKELKKRAGKAVSYHPDAQITIDQPRPVSRRRKAEPEEDLMEELGLDEDHSDLPIPEATIENVMKLLVEVCQRLDDLQEDVSALLEDDEMSEDDE